PRRSRAPAQVALEEGDLLLALAVGANELPQADALRSRHAGADRLRDVQRLRDAGDVKVRTGRDQDDAVSRRLALPEQGHDVLAKVLLHPARCETLGMGCYLRQGHSAKEGSDQAFLRASG